MVMDCAESLAHDDDWLWGLVCHVWPSGLVGIGADWGIDCLSWRGERASLEESPAVWIALAGRRNNVQMVGRHSTLELPRRLIPRPRSDFAATT